jgi:hypothetical protein
MKKILKGSLAVLSFWAVLNTSCTKNDAGSGGNGSDTSVFTKKIVLEDLTGAWCGFCPRVAYAIETYKTTHPDNFIALGVHSGSGSDPFKFSNYSAYLPKYNISGYPSAVLNRKEEWSENESDLDAALTEPALCGMSITSSATTDQLNNAYALGTVKVKFGTNMTGQSLKIVVALVENGLVASQTNYYSTSYGYTPYLYGGVSPITNFVHNGVLRRTATDLWGDAIPSEQQTKNNEYSLDFNMPLTGTTASGTSYTVDKTKAAIVTIVVDETDPNNIHALNAQYADLGTTKNYD